MTEFRQRLVNPKTAFGPSLRRDDFTVHFAEQSHKEICQVFKVTRLPSDS